MPEQFDGRTVHPNEFFFCLNCRITAELDKHGRCATCGSDAVAYPGSYKLRIRESDAYLSEKNAPQPANDGSSEELDRFPESALVTAGISQ
jgi:hypothetical protein